MGSHVTPVQSAHAAADRAAHGLAVAARSGEGDAMELNLPEWAHLVLRWFHIVAGIAWIGSSFFFMWLDSHLETRPDAPEGDKGELWMVHSGGFYQVKKLLLGPGQVPKTLHWFKWEATLTWLSGFLLLLVVYYHGGAMVDPESARLSSAAASALGVGSLVVGWFVYDAIWRWLRSEPTVAALLSVALLVVAAIGLSHLLSARAAYMHVGAMLGTMMVLNVWVHILPAQRAMIAATESGARMDPRPGESAKARSVHNNYMTFPVIFVMISNHFPMTYGHVASWGVLMVLFVASAGVRHFMNKPREGTGWMLGVAGLLLVGLIVFSAPSMQGLYTPSMGGRAASSGERAERAARAHVAQRDVFPGSQGAIRATVRFDGTPSTRAAVAMTGECATLQHGAVPAPDLLVSSGRLENVFVWISSGHEGWRPPPVPDTPVVLDQRGCLYSPRVAGARVGQPVELVNSDPVLHNVNVRGVFNLAMPTRGQRIRRRFEREETMVRVKCDVHPWMAAFVGVLEHPWFAVSAADGRATIEGVPPGRYEVSAWHEVLGRRSTRVTLEARGQADVELVFAEGR